MATHISLRLAWHDHGWDGTICRNPKSNTYCSGAHSYPGQMIFEEKDTIWEQSVAGQTVEQAGRCPACQYSFNAFSPKGIVVSDNPPDFYKSGSKVVWKVPPYTACIWPYEEMYRDEALTNGKQDPIKRSNLIRAFFDALKPHKSLVFYYANYSNPLSTEDQNHYLLIGVTRIASIGELVRYDNLKQEDIERYGGFAWQRNVTSDYPNAGFRIPYHLYMDNPEVLERLAVFPDNDRCFKYAARHMTDDDALALVERFIEVAIYLRDELKDKSEDWFARVRWLESLFVELWKGRGLYPGFASVMEILRLSSGVPLYRKAVDKGEESKFRDQVMAWIKKQSDALPNWPITPAEEKSIRREWQLLKPEEQQMLSEVLPRFDLTTLQMRQILDESERTEYGVDSVLSDIAENPFILCEEYQGASPDDQISYSRIEHGIYPSPELGGSFFFDINAWQRLRALCVTRLKSEPQHTFLPQPLLIQEVNRRIFLQPEWKRATFTDRYFEVDKDDLEAALEFREEGKCKYVYLRSVYDAERTVEKQIRTLALLPQITLKTPVTTSTWVNFLTKEDCDLARADRSVYDEAIASQADVCTKIFRSHVSVICGSAGTGKTTVVESIIRAIEKAHGKGTPFCLLAPTGKAADRLRDRTGKDAYTIHSFLAQHGWLRNNMSFRSVGGKREAGITTYIIDECSMLDLDLTASLFRAINWNAVQRIVLVGDPNQLPPIGKGRVFADIIDWLRKNQSECVGELTINLRQLENRIKGRGTGILDLAEVFIGHPFAERSNTEAKLHAEDVFRRLQDLPPDGAFDKDLSVIYWKDTKELHGRIVESIIIDMENDSGGERDTNNLWLLRDKAWKNSRGATRPDYQQVISPYRAEDYGTQALNILIQNTFVSAKTKLIGSLAGIYLFDKVIQFRNRGQSERIGAYNFDTRKNEKVSIFNGELGIVMPHLWDMDKLKQGRLHLSRFVVKFARKENYSVGYGKMEDATEKPEENLELAYAISVHKSQGSEFERVYFVLPKSKAALLSPELLYTGLTRASRHCTIFIEEDVSPLLQMYRPESSHLIGINTSLFDFKPVPAELTILKRESKGFKTEYRIHRTLAEIMVRSKSEVIIANMLFDRDISFDYEKPLYADDGTFYLPDFTISWRGDTYYWEHLGLLEQDEYRNKWIAKKVWYEKNFPGRLLITEESGNLSKDAESIINKFFS